MADDTVEEASSGEESNFDARVPAWLFWVIVGSLMCACGWGILGRLCGWTDPAAPIAATVQRKEREEAKKLRLEAKAHAAARRRQSFSSARRLSESSLKIIDLHCTSTKRSGTTGYHAVYPPFVPFN